MATPKTFIVEIVSPERKVFSGNAEFAVFPGIEGQLGILANHAPILSALLPGEIKIIHNGKPAYFAVSGGFLEIKENKVTVAAETCEAASEIDKDRAQRAKQAALADLQEKKVNIEAMLKWKRAEARLKVSIKATLPDQSKH
jgi:F-type H+-transporting ATPase subunit epsilon